MMRPKPAEETPHASRQVLVLGLRRRGLGVSELIASALEEAGFEVVEDRFLPPFTLPTDLDGMEALRTGLSEFASASPPPAGFANCVHPGLTAWADRPEFPAHAQEAGLNAICPPARVLSLFANKLNLFGEAERLGIPNLLLSGDPMHAPREIERLIETRVASHRYPFVLKAVRGGRSYGILTIHEHWDLAHQVPLWFEQLRRNLGEVIVFAERYVEGGRRVALPFARFMDGTFKAFPMVDGSLRSRGREMLELCPASEIDSDVADELREKAELLARQCNFVGVGVLDFMIDGSSFYLIDGSARLGSGFHLWERVAGTRAVAWQLATIEGLKDGLMPECEPRRDLAYGLCARILAEDLLLQLPQPGDVYALSEKREWSFPGARAELTLSVVEGSNTPIQGDGDLGALWVWAKDRKLALTAARGIFSEIWIAGSLQTNERFLAELVSHSFVREGMFHAGFLDEEFLPSIRAPAEILRIMASLCQMSAAQSSVGRSDESARWAVGDQWVRSDPSAVRWIDAPTFSEVPSLPVKAVFGVVELTDGTRPRACAVPSGSDRWQARVGLWAFSIKRVVAGVGTRQKASKILAMVPGRVHSILYRTSALVPAHEPIVLVESLGMLVPHALPVESRILRWFVSADDSVAAGDLLGEIEPPLES